MAPAPWWARFLVTIALLTLASRMIVAQDQLAIAGAIVGIVGAHWLPSSGPRDVADVAGDSDPAGRRGSQKRIDGG